MKESKAIVAVNSATNEVKEFKSINEAARELEGTFCQVQRAMLTGGKVKGWAIYGSAEIIQSQIDDLQKKLEFVKSI